MSSSPRLESIAEGGGGVKSVTSEEPTSASDHAAQSSGSEAIPPRDESNSTADRNGARPSGQTPPERHAVEEDTPKAAHTTAVLEATAVMAHPNGVAHVESASAGFTYRRASPEQGTTVAAGIDPSSNSSGHRRPPLTPSQAPAILQAEQQQQQQQQPSAAPPAAASGSAFVPVQQLIKPVPSHPVPPPAVQPYHSVSPASEMQQQSFQHSLTPPAPAHNHAAPTVSTGLSPFNNPSLNFSWPVFSPASASHSPLVVEPSPYHPPQPAYQSPPPPPPMSMHYPPAVPSPHSGHFTLPSPHSANFAPPPPLMPQLTPEQQQYLQAGWQQAQFYQQQQYAQFQQQQQQHYSPYHSPAPNPNPNPFYQPHQSYDPAYGGSHLPPPSFNQHSPMQASLAATSAPRNWSSPATSATSPPLPTALPTAAYTAPSFTPISPPLKSLSSSSATKAKTGPAQAPPGLMVLAPRKTQQPTVVLDTSSEESSSEDDSNSSSSEDERHAPMSARGRSLHAPAPSFLVRSPSDPTHTPTSPRRAQKGQRPPIDTARRGSASSDTTHSLRTSPSPSSATSTTSSAGPGSAPRKLSWKIVTKAQAEADRKKAEVIARERENLASNRHVERVSDATAAVASASSSRAHLSTPTKPNELTRRSPASRSPALSLTPTPTRRGSDAKAAAADVKAKARPASSENSGDLEVALFLTAVLVAVAATCALLFLR